MKMAAFLYLKDSGTRFHRDQEGYVFPHVLQGSFPWVRDRVEGLESMLRPEPFCFLAWLVTKGVMEHAREEPHEVSRSTRGPEWSGRLQEYYPQAAPHSNQRILPCGDIPGS